MEKLLISRCFLGELTTYNEKHHLLVQLKALEEKYTLISVCPEVDGGLPTPRLPSERINNLVLMNNGTDVTKEYHLGAQIALDICKKEGITKALLKAKSPSCGSGKIYDGTFSKTLIEGDGVTSELLKANGIRVYNEMEIDELL